MTVSSETAGRRPLRTVRVPSVVGLHERDARIVLESAGLTRIRTHMVRGYAAEHEVARQRPEAGDLVDRGREVWLEVSRQSIVDFLPSSYQKAAETDDGALSGFLYIVQEIGDRVERRLAQIHELFDPRHTDADFLPWLGSWLAITLNPDWTELQRRKMLMAAAKLFPHRGTAKAVAEFVRIYTGAEVTITENVWPFPGFRIGVHSTIGAHTVILPTMNLAHCFVVHLDQAASQVPDDDIVRIHQIIGAQKPAHTAYFLSFVDEEEAGAMGTFIEIGMGAIGVDAGGGVVVSEEEESTSASAEASSDAAVEEDTAAAKSKKAKARASSSRKTRRARATKDAKPEKKGAKPEKKGAKPEKKDAKPEKKDAKPEKGAKKKEKARRPARPKRSAKASESGTSARTGKARKAAEDQGAEKTQKAEGGRRTSRTGTSTRKRAATSTRSTRASADDTAPRPKKSGKKRTGKSGKKKRKDE